MFPRFVPFYLVLCLEIPERALNRMPEFFFVDAFQKRILSLVFDLSTKIIVRVMVLILHKIYATRPALCSGLNLY